MFEFALGLGIGLVTGFVLMCCFILHEEDKNDSKRIDKWIV